MNPGFASTNRGQHGPSFLSSQQGSYGPSALMHVSRGDAASFAPAAAPLIVEYWRLLRREKARRAEDDAGQRDRRDGVRSLARHDAEVQDLQEIVLRTEPAHKQVRL